ncbi:hypothetical protein [Limobrevibacterium gyesilva]|uniref:Uncharacterized protein n=1 Tax=Limobrevibacterium gyesilva TaxID=2991712 RepID=A0AA41YSS0_9PROT|nr:hypothetical protein [Limobrevibacterium gyesilva]MCW3477658.1 hypothetical protein [Limobrevibacterium gyesilva]
MSMGAGRVQDMVRRGLGRAAMALGEPCDAFRPDGARAPVTAANRFLRLPASFAPPGEGYARPPAYGQALWWGIFDAAYTRPGDYLRRGDGAVWFIASQEPLLPVLCVRAERVVDLLRPAGAVQPGLNSYGGVVLAAAETLLAGWPASVLAGGGGGGGGGGGMRDAGLPGEAPAGSWVVLLPAVAGVALRRGDLMTDDLGRTGVVASAELSAPGWRLVVKQAAP